MDSAKAYEIHARNYLISRDQSNIGADIIERWSRTLNNGAMILELACGGGYPITSILQNAGLKIWAMDSSPTLISEFKIRFPMIPVQCAKVQECDFFGQKYDAILAIGLIFLLSEADQLNLITRISSILKVRGRFMFTAPIEKGEWKDLITGLTCKSLGIEIYEKQLIEAGFHICSTFVDQGGNNYYEVERIN